MRESTKKEESGSTPLGSFTKSSESTKKPLQLIPGMQSLDEALESIRKKQKKVKKGKSKGKIHRPTKETRCIVAVLIANGHTQDETAKAIGITKPTLEKYYRIEIDFAAIYAVKMVEGVLFKNCMLGREKSIFFFLKNRGGNRWNEADGEDHNAKLAELIAVMRPSIKDAAT